MGHFDAFVYPLIWRAEKWRPGMPIYQEMLFHCGDGGGRPRRLIPYGSFTASPPDDDNDDDDRTNNNIIIQL